MNGRRPPHISISNSGSAIIPPKIFIHMVSKEAMRIDRKMVEVGEEAVRFIVH
jgi:hypothetical protein